MTTAPEVEVIEPAPDEIPRTTEERLRRRGRVTRRQARRSRDAADHPARLRAWFSIQRIARTRADPAGRRRAVRSNQRFGAGLYPSEGPVRTTVAMLNGPPATLRSFTSSSTAVGSFIVDTRPS